MPRRAIPRDQRPTIPLSDGDYLVPRFALAAECGMSERTVARRVETVLIAGCAYVIHDASLKRLVEEAKQFNSPVLPLPRRRGR